MRKTTKEKLSCYSMKMRIYPSPAQAEKIDRILRALELMYNMTFHEVFQGNPHRAKLCHKGSPRCIDNNQ